MPEQKSKERDESMESHGRRRYKNIGAQAVVISGTSYSPGSIVDAEIPAELLNFLMQIGAIGLEGNE